MLRVDIQIYCYVVVDAVNLGFLTDSSNIPHGFPKSTWGQINPSAFGQLTGLGENGDLC